MNFKRVLALIAISALTLSACTPVSTTPSLDNPSPSRLSYEACRQAGFNFKTFTSQNVKALVQCLNGSTNALGPVKDYLESVSDADLNQTLDALNKHWPWGSPRQIQVLDLIKEMQARGHLKSLLVQLEILLRTKWAGASLQLLASALRGHSKTSLDKDVQNMTQFVAQVLNPSSARPLLQSLKVFNSDRAQNMAALLGTDFPGRYFTAEKLTEIAAGNISEMIQKEAFLPLISALAKKQTLLALGGTDSEMRKGFNNAFYYYSLDPQNDYLQFRRSQVVIRESDNELQCVPLRNPDGPQNILGYSRKNGNILRFIVDEIKGRSKAENDVFLIQTLPMLISATKDVCAFPPKLVSHYDSLSLLAKSGYSQDLGRFWQVLTLGPAFPDLLRALKSEHFTHFTPLIGEASQRGALGYFWEWAALDLNESVAQAWSDFLLRLAQNGADESLSRLLLKTLQANGGTYSGIQKWREALVNVWAEDKGGIGGFLDVVSQVDGISTQSPLMDFFRDVLNDQDFVAAVSPAAVRMIENKNFEPALEFLAKLARTGDFEKLLVFFVDLLKGEKPSALADRSSLRFEPPKKAELYPKAFLAEAKAQTVSWDSCFDLKPDFFAQDGSGLEAGSACLNANGDAPAVFETTQALKNAGMLSVAAQWLKSNFVISPELAPSLDQIELLKSKGYTSSFFSLLGLWGQPRFKLTENIDSLALSLLSHSKIEAATTLIGELLKQKTFLPVVTQILDWSLKNPKPVYSISPSFKVTLAQPQQIRAQIAGFYPQLPDSEVQKIFNQAKENFETRNTQWQFVEGNYTDWSKGAFQNQVILILQNLLRTTDFEEFIAALQDVSQKNGLYAFIKYLANQQMVAMNYGNDGNLRPHIMTGLDALENLVLNSDFGYAYVGNVGTTFQLAVQGSKDYVRTIEDQWGQLQLGESISSLPGVGNKEKNKKFKNMIGSFTPLRLIADNKMLYVLQRMYRAMYNATPSQDKSNQDPQINHMGLIHHFHKLGIFQNLVAGFLSLESQGQGEAFFKNISEVILRLSPQDVAALKQSLILLMSQHAKNPGASALTEGVSTVWDGAVSNSLTHQNIKLSLVHLILAQSQLQPLVDTIVKVLPEWSKNANWMKYSIIEGLRALGESQNGVLNLTNHLLVASQGQVDKVRAGFNSALQNPNAISALVLLSDAFESQPQIWSQYVKQVQTWSEDPAVKDVHGVLLLLNILSLPEFQNTSGIRQLLSGPMVDPQQRRITIQLLKTLAQQGKLKGLVEYLSERARRGQLQEALDFLFDHFQK